MQPSAFEEVLDQIVAQDPRYQREAYSFVREALDFTQQMASKSNRNLVRHISGKELLEGIRQYGLAQYGPMLHFLLTDWGICRCEDFGEIVFNLVQHRVLQKTQQDSRKDFQDGYDFFTAFQVPFLPSRQAAKVNQPLRPTQARE